MDFLATRVLASDALFRLYEHLTQPALLFLEYYCVQPAPSVDVRASHRFPRSFRLRNEQARPSAGSREGPEHVVETDAADLPGLLFWEIVLPARPTDFCTDLYRYLSVLTGPTSPIQAPVVEMMPVDALVSVVHLRCGVDLLRPRGSDKLS